MAAQLHEQSTRSRDELVNIAVRRMLARGFAKLAISEGDDSAQQLVESLKEAAGIEHQLQSMTLASHDDVLMEAQYNGSVAVIPSDLSISALRQIYGWRIAGPLPVQGAGDYSLIASLDHI
jgi:hypothetical protein